MFLLNKLREGRRATRAAPLLYLPICKRIEHFLIIRIENLKTIVAAVSMKSETGTH
ncbi:MAG: hypothetical protein RLZZ398_533 [Verrucomicrobiota bacterium]